MYNSGVKSLRCYSFCKTMYRHAKSVDWCQCCQQGVTFPDAEGSSDFFGNGASSQIIHSSDNAGCFHRSAMRHSTQAVPYNYFSICATYCIFSHSPA